MVTPSARSKKDSREFEEQSLKYSLMISAYSAVGTALTSFHGGCGLRVWAPVPGSVGGLLSTDQPSPRPLLGSWEPGNLFSTC